MMYNYFRRYPYNPSYIDNNYKRDFYDVKHNDDIDKRSSLNKAPSGFSFLNNFLNQDDREENEKFFELFGLKLYHDDILLLSLIFFLYKEDVKDQYLFFALILLLLS